MIDRRTFLGALASGLFAAPLAAEAQPAGKVYRIGFLSSTGCPIRAEIMGPFRQGLLEFGYVEGQNITIECRGVRGATDHLPVFAAELVRLNVDVLVGVGTASAQAAKHATKTIPTVMVSVGDSVGSGLVTDMARPGGNVTGLSAFAPGMVPKALEFLKEAAPSVSRVGVDRSDESRADVGRSTLGRRIRGRPEATCGSLVRACAANRAS